MKDPSSKAEPGDRPPRWQVGTAFTLACALMLVAGYGAGTFVRSQLGPGSQTGPAGGAGASSSSSGPKGQTPFTLYLTDAIGNVTDLDLHVGGVLAGPDLLPMTVLQSSFDLASLHGPSQALALATGDVPAADRQQVVVVFTSATAAVDGVRREATALEPLVFAQDAAVPGDHLLIDVDPTASLVDDNGSLAFVPQPKAVYFAPGSAPSAAPEWGVAVAPPPVSESVLRSARSAQDLVEAGSATSLPGGTEAPGLVGDAAGSAGSSASAASTWIVQFRDGTSSDQVAQAINGTGGVLVHPFASLPAASLLATAAQAAVLAQDSRVQHIERERPVVFDDSSSRTALRIAQVVDAPLGLLDGSGRPIRGTGIGVAVVDSGIDGTHPDLAYRPLVPGGVVGGNYKLVGSAAVPLADTDTTSGHGTHVASIVAGQGVADPTQVGVAPGATLYGLGIGEDTTTLWAAQAFDWILANGASQDPPIRVVTNSWHSGTTYDPDSVLTTLVGRMVDAGMVVVFAAGNDGGDGSVSHTSAQCQIPRAGVLCVAAYDDLGTGTRDGKVAPYSSRGAADQPSTWPDLSAPGTSVRGARPLAGAQTGLAVSAYTELSGTSQAAPHVAGIAALMLQADPSLTPAQVEGLLTSTAHAFTDGGAYSTSSADPGGHYAKGHGLADAYAAVQAALG